MISQRFRRLLLSNPDKALETGYAGERFRLPYEARRCISAIHAENLAEFAEQLNQGIEMIMQVSWSGD